MSKSKYLFKSKKSSMLKKTLRSNFSTSGARLAFTKLRQAFIKALIFYHFDSECHIRVETDVSGYAIGGVFSQLTLDDFGLWHPVAIFSQKMIPVETRYKIHNDKLLAIVEDFKTWKYYLEGSQHEILILTNHNNLCWFIDIMNLSFKQV